MRRCAAGRGTIKWDAGQFSKWLACCVCISLRVPKWLAKRQIVWSVLSSLQMVVEVSVCVYRVVG